MPEKPYNPTRFWQAEDPLHDAEFETFLKEENEAIAGAATSDLRTRHLDFTLTVLDGIRTSGLAEYHELEGKGEPPVDPDPFWRTVRELENHIRKLSSAKESQALFGEQQTPLASVAPQPKKAAAASAHLQDSPYYLVPEAAAYCRCKESKIYHAAECGELHGTKQGKWRFTKENLDDWINLKGNEPQ